MFSNEFYLIFSEYPGYEIHLEMDLLSSLDLLVDLARVHRINVKIPYIQQTILYKTKYKHLFEYDSSNLASINDNFQLKDRPKVKVNVLGERNTDEYIRYIFLILLIQNFHYIL